MGLFVHKCYRICHLSPSARFRQHIKHSCLWPAVYSRCLPSLPRPCAHTWKKTSRSQAIPRPPRLVRAGRHLPPHPPCPEGRLDGRGGGGEVRAERLPKAEDALPPADGRGGQRRPAPGCGRGVRGEPLGRAAAAFAAAFGVPGPASAAGQTSPWRDALVTPEDHRIIES